MSSSVVRRQKFQKAPPQPIDRHLAEIDGSDGTIYINAGIDSTCCKKRGRMIHTLTNGIVVSSQTQMTTTRSICGSGDDLLLELTNDSLNDDQLDSINSQCSHCGK
ncbi:unnamed protein product [Rotaria sordida]|uniref:Uncharacterized protein n=1 Tax=Rotaria sordida TaxID=392033 RepID=A0A816F0D5_9BILA|nr:unnamed protein product [Rotaria sordida]CAF1498538.1 unnamed protein product [Rotaria sordida]CAF1654290.1 unnamed protein product [Rotaria sordida]CAF3679443.1 unnamed protein product [Rotaria sordida]